AQVIGMAINGGTEALWMNYYRKIDKTKVQFDFLVESESKIINKEEIESMGGHVVIIPPYSNPFKYMKALKKIFNENQYDIVHSNMSTLSVFTLRAAKKAGIKVRIAHSHSTSNKKEWKKNLVKNLLRPFSKVYSTHYFTCSELAGRYLFGNKTYDKGLVKIINNAIDLKKFSFNEENRNEIRTKLGVTDDIFVIGHIGRFQRQKNHRYLIDIYNCYVKNNPNSRLLLVGNGPLLDEITSYVKELKIDDKVIFYGITTEIFKVYSAMDAFVLPSLYEGLPVVGIEAQANGLPCYFSDTITIEVKINDNVLFESIKNDPSMWANEIVKKERLTNFKNSIYDIDNEIIKLTEEYYRILNK
ncbi:MAG: glycosyltransferase family 1 protein, partial [Anaeroplasma sp.]